MVGLRKSTEYVNDLRYRLIFFIQFYIDTERLLDFLRMMDPDMRHQNGHQNSTKGSDGKSNRRHMIICRSGQSDRRCRKIYSNTGSSFCESCSSGSSNGSCTYKYKYCYEVYTRNFKGKRCRFRFLFLLSFLFTFPLANNLN